MSVTHKKKGGALRHANGLLKAEAKKRAMDLVTRGIETGRPKSEVIKQLREEFSLKTDKAKELFAQGEALFLETHGHSKEQMRFLIYKKNMEILAEENVSHSQVSAAVRNLSSIFDLAEKKASDDKTDKVRLWKRVFEHSTVAELDEYIEQMRNEVFRLDEITESVAETIAERKK